jgi:hypothetical protein
MLCLFLAAFCRTNVLTPNVGVVDNLTEKAATITFVAANLESNNNERLPEFQLALKSLLINARCSLHIVFMVAKEADCSTIRQFFSILKTPRTEVVYTFRFIDAGYVQSWLDEWQLQPQHHGGIPSISKFFLPHFLPGLSQSIVLDLDVIVGEDIGVLWNEFTHFGRDTSVAFSPYASDMGHAFDEFCCGIGLYDLDNMRAAGWSSLETGGSNQPGQSVNFKLAFENVTVLETIDQTMFSAIWKFARQQQHSQFYRQLSNSWNLESCGKENHYGVFPGTSPVDSNESSALYFGIYHYNCGVVQEWQVVVNYYKSFNLQWLNGGRTVQNVFEVSYQDFVARNAKYQRLA